MSPSYLATLYREHGDLVFSLALQFEQNHENGAETACLYRITSNKSHDFLNAKERQKRFVFLTTLLSESPRGNPWDSP